MRYYIRQHRRHVSGPHEIEAIRQWVKEGKVRSEMEFSVDGKEWMLGIEMVELFGRPAPRAPSTRRRRSRRRR
jgi:hypothetical protein